MPLRSDSVPPWRWRIDLPAALILVALMILTLIVFLREPGMSDDMVYFDMGSRLFGGATDFDGALYRIPPIFAAAVAHAIFGYTFVAYYAVPFFFHTALIVCIYLLCRRFFPVEVALGACILFLTNYHFLLHGTVLLGDWMTLVWIVIGFLLCLHAMTNVGSHSRQRTLGLIAGLFFFLSMWTKSSAFLSLIPLAIGLFVVGPRQPMLRVLPWILIGFAGGEGFELVFNQVYFGDAFIRIREVVAGSGTQLRLRGDFAPPDLTWWDLFIRYLRILTTSVSGYVVLVGSVVGMLMAAVARSRGLVFFTIVTIATFLMLSFAVVSLDPLIPILRTKNRYFSIVLIFMPILTSAGIWRLMVWSRTPEKIARWRSTAHLAVVVILAGVQLTDARTSPHFMINGANPLMRTHELLTDLRGDSARPLKRVLSDSRTRRGLRMFIPTDLQTEIRSFNEYYMHRARYMDIDDFMPGDFVVMNWDRMEFDIRTYHHPVPIRYHFPPPNWELLDALAISSSEYYYVHPPGTRGHLADADAGLVSPTGLPSAFSDQHERDANSCALIDLRRPLRRTMIWDDVLVRDRNNRLGGADFELAAESPGGHWIRPHPKLLDPEVFSLPSRGEYEILLLAPPSEGLSAELTLLGYADRDLHSLIWEYRATLGNNPTRIVARTGARPTYLRPFLHVQGGGTLSLRQALVVRAPLADDEPRPRLHQDLTSDLNAWVVWKLGKDAVTTREDAGPRVSFELEDGEKAWFAPRTNLLRPDELRLAANTTYEVLFRIDSPPTAHVYVDVRLFETAELRNIAQQHGTSLVNGDTRLVITTPDADLYACPFFLLSGKGPVEFETFLIVVRPDHLPPP